MAVTHQDGRITMTAAADTYLPERTLRLYGLNWSGATDGHDLVVQDQDNKQVYGWKAETDALSHDWECPLKSGLPLEELTCSTLDGGTVVFYVSE